MVEEIIYTYCVTKEVPKLEEAENLVDKLYSLYHNGLYAVVSRVSKDEFGEENLKKNLADFAWVKRKASVHEKVIEAVMKNSCVVPFKFATLFNSENNLKLFLEQHLQQFLQNLKDLEGKEEWGVKIYCDLEKLRKRLLEKDEELLKIDKEVSSSLAGKGFFLKKKKEGLLNRLVNKEINECGQVSFDRLSQHSPQRRINKLLPKEVTEKKDEMILNSAFLIDRKKVTEFLQTAGALSKEYSNEGISLDCTGPWPPYNFCQLSKEKAHNE